MCTYQRRHHWNGGIGNLEVYGVFGIRGVWGYYCNSKSEKALPHTPCLWLSYVDDTFVIQEAKDSQQLLQIINSHDPHIQFTIEEPNQDGALPFLDTLVSPGPNNTLITTVYRKSTHADQYLHWECNHFITVKNSFFITLGHRTKVVCTNQQALHKEMEHMRNALQACNFPPRAVNTLQTNLTANTTSQWTNIHWQPTWQQQQWNKQQQQQEHIYSVVPYIHGLGERFKRTCNNLGIHVHFKGTNTPHSPHGQGPQTSKEWSHI